MYKSTNKVQLDIMLSRMKDHPEMARGFIRENKLNTYKFWQNLEVALNNAGPPTKNVSEWKKVWLDQKRHVRQKASAAGPRVRLSRWEEEIRALIELKESVVDAKKSHTTDETYLVTLQPASPGLCEVINLKEETSSCDSVTAASPPPSPQNKPNSSSREFEASQKETSFDDNASPFENSSTCSEIYAPSSSRKRKCSDEPATQFDDPLDSHSLISLSKKRNVFDVFAESIATQLKELSEKEAYLTMAEMQSMLSKKKIKSLQKALRK